MSDVCSETRELDAIASVVTQRQRGETVEEVLERMQAKFGRQQRPETPMTSAPARDPVGIERGCPAERDEAPVPPQLGKHPECKPAESAIVEAIRRRSRDNGISAAELGAVAHTDQRTARAIIAHLIEVHELAIASTPGESFFWPDRWEDLNSTFASIASRRRALNEREAGLRRAAERRWATLPLFGRGDQGSPGER